MSPSSDHSRLRTLGSMVDDRSPDQELSARTAARLLFGAVCFVSARYGVAEMQQACAELAEHDEAWRTKFRVLPRSVDGAPAEPMVAIAGMARGILPLAGATKLRAALAWWATECDPDAWRRMVPND